MDYMLEHPDYFIDEPDCIECKQCKNIVALDDIEESDLLCLQCVLEEEYEDE